MASIFTKIVKGEIPCYKLLEDDRFLAFLDVSPLTKGHALVIPKAEVDYIFDMDDDLLADLMVFSKKVATGLKKAIPCIKVGVSVIGLEVPHAHIHLIPMLQVSDMNFSKSKCSFSKEEMEETASSIRSFLI